MDPNRTIPQEPNWFTGDLEKYPDSKQPPKKYSKNDTIQQSDLLKPLLIDSAKHGLPYASAKFIGVDNLEEYISATTTKPKKVLIVGAGMAGLVAGFEIQRAGHEVEILEMTDRAGGRVKTFGESDGFSKGLYVDGGAMRLPGPVDDPNKPHFLTDFYNEKFNMPLLPFHNFDKNGYVKYYDEEVMTHEEWNKGGKKNFDKLWPGWDKTLVKNGLEHDITDLGTYYSRTTEVITGLLRKRLNNAKTQAEQAKEWELWIKNWSRFSLDSFLRSEYKSVEKMVNIEDIDDLKPLKKLLPWPDEALDGYSVFSYTIALDTSLVQYLREDLGLWWTNTMHRIDGGMSRLTDTFLKEQCDSDGRKSQLLPSITFNSTVKAVKFASTSLKNVHNKVIVEGIFTTSGRKFLVEGDAIIVTVPLNTLRQIRFIASPGTEKLPLKFHHAIEDVWYGPSTKVMIQSKKRFWEKDGIRGGFTKQACPIGQIHYPSNSTGESLADEKGILLCYTWKSEALLFGSLPPQSAIQEAVREIAEIHPEIEENFEVGAVQAWYSDPASLGAYALLKPGQYNNTTFMMLPWKNVYFAGEGISFATGWIQGALESGLRAAYQFYVRDELYG